MRTEPTIAESGRIYLKKQQDRRALNVYPAPLETQGNRRFPKVPNYVRITFFLTLLRRLFTETDASLSHRIWRLFPSYRRRQTLERLSRLTGGSR